MKIEVKDIKKEFKNSLIFENVNYTFESGNIYVLTGPNGCGKSVFLKVLCGFYMPTEGNVTYDGVNYSLKKEFPMCVRALIDKPSFISDMTGYKNLEVLAAILNKIGKKEIEETLKDVNLYQEKDKKYSEYSLGMKQKLGIAQVLMENPEVIVLDEPFNGLDKTSAKKIRELLIKEKENGKIIIIASHIEEDIKSLATHILEFDDYKVKELKWYL